MKYVVQIKGKDGYWRNVPRLKPFDKEEDAIAEATRGNISNIYAYRVRTLHQLTTAAKPSTMSNEELQREAYVILKVHGLDPDTASPSIWVAATTLAKETLNHRGEVPATKTRQSFPGDDTICDPR